MKIYKIKNTYLRRMALIGFLFAIPVVIPYHIFMSVVECLGLDDLARSVKELWKHKK